MVMQRFGGWMFLILLIALASVARAHGDPNAATAEDKAVAAGKRLLAAEYPAAVRHMARYDGFGGPGSHLIANRMLSRDPALVAEARSKMSVEPHGEGLWLIRFPYVNVVLVETADSLVLLDTGYAAMGPVLKELIPTLSPKPLKTLVITHSHVDHAFGAFALTDAKPEVITSDLFPTVVDSQIRLRGSISRYNNQPVELEPKSRADMVMPTLTFGGRLEKTIGGERFVFAHAPAETEDQIYIWLPDRRTVVTADYYQGFLPNAGNGKRMQRHVEEWIGALRDMAALKPALLLPMHGQALTGEAEIAGALNTTADAIEHIARQVVDRLNRGERKDAIVSSIDWPERFATSPLLEQSYVRPDDIAKMVAKRWTGWWDDIPSHFAALNFEEEAKEALALAGGVEAVDARARALLPTRPRLAARLADWAQFGAPDSAKAQRLAVDVYMARILAPDTPLQESTVYFEAAAKARMRLKELEGR